MAYDNKVNLFSMNPASQSKTSLTSSAQKSVANRGDYAVKQNTSKADDFSSQLDKAQTKAEAKESPVKDTVDTKPQDKSQPKTDDVVKNPQDAVNEVKAEANPNDAVANQKGEAQQNDTVTEQPADNTDSAASLFQFMSYSGSIDALLGGQQLQPMPEQTVVQPIAENMVQQLQTGAQQLSQAVQTMAEAADGVMDLPDGFKQVIQEAVQPNSIEALLTPVAKDAAVANEQTMLNVLSGNAKQPVIQQMAQTVQNPEMVNLDVQPADVLNQAQNMQNVQAQQPAIQLETPLKTNEVLNNAVQAENSDNEAMNTLSNMLEGVKVAVETQSTGDSNQQSLHQQFAQQNQQAVNTQGEVQPAQIPGEAAFDMAPVENATQDTSTVAGANFQQQFASVDDLDNTQQVQQPQQSATDYEIPKQIVEQARLIRAGQDTEMVIKLNPQHLGDLTLKVSVNANGGVTASFHSDNATVRGILETSMVQLKQELTEQGIKVDKVEISAGLQQELPQDLGQGYYAQQGGQQNTSTRGNLSSYEDGEGVEGVAGAAAVDEDGVPVNQSTEPVRDSQGNIISDGVDYKV